MSSENTVIKFIFAILLCAALGPVLLTPIPAMVDYPNHLARMYLLSAAGAPDANPFYRAAWALYPNLAMDLAIPQFARLISVENATRLFLLLSQILLIGGAMTLERVVKGRVQLSGFVAVLFLYCLPFAWGFVNFEFGLGVAVWGVAAMLAVKDETWPVRLIVNAAFVAALFAAHFFALGIYGATLGIYELWRARQGADVRWLVGRLIVLAAPAVVLLAIMMTTAGGIGGEGTEWFFAFKALWPFRILNGYSLTVSAASVVALLGFVYLAAKRGVLCFAPGGLWLAIGFALLYVAIPSKLFGTSFVDFRVIAAAAFILPAFCTLALPDRRWTFAALGCVSVVAVANLAVVYAVWLPYRADYAALIASFDRIEKGATVLTGTSGSGDDPPFNDLTEYPLYYAPVLAVHYARAFVPNLFAEAGKQPVIVRPDMRHLAVAYGGPVPLTILTALAAGKTADIVPSYLRNWTNDFRYLYVLGPPADNPLPALLEERARSSRFVLYEVRRRAD